METASRREVHWGEGKVMISAMIGEMAYFQRSKGKERNGGNKWSGRREWNPSSLVWKASGPATRPRPLGERGDGATPIG